MSHIRKFSSKDFLVDVKHEIKCQFKNQGNFADATYRSRKVLSRILNNPNDLTINQIGEFCEKLGLDLSAYIY